MARDGSWGIATAGAQSQAIAIAIRECRVMSSGLSDCGAEFTTIRTGWTLALRCGDYRVLVAAKTLKDAQRAALNREIDLNLYDPDLPPCQHVLIVDPNGAVATANVQSQAAVAVAVEDSEQEWTVVTMARDGSWGVANDASMSRAISAAIRDCRAMSAGQNDCGAEFTTIRKGWTLALFCGDERILAAAKGREEAESSVELRIKLKRAYLPDLPPCRRVLSVDPSGAVVVAQAQN
jgi:hypothetical protein